jgi:hypothetical protein
VDDGVEAAGMELGKIVLQHPVEGECDVLEIHAIIERNVAADVDVQHRRRRENVFDAVGQLAKDPRHIREVAVGALGAVAVHEQNRFHRLLSLIRFTLLGDRILRPRWLSLV